MSQPVEADMFLLESQPNLNSVVAQIVVESCFLGRQPVQVHPQGLVLATPYGGVRIKGCSVHQERSYVIKVASQLVQNAEAVGVDIAPVMD